MLDIVVNSLYTNKDVFLREVCMRPAVLSAWICLASFCPDSINPVQWRPLHTVALRLHRLLIYLTLRPPLCLYLLAFH